MLSQTASALVQWREPLSQGGTSMRGNAFIPQDYDLFAGLDVDKRSISVAFSNHQGFIRSLHKGMPV